ncbi:MAG: hypothetical protein K2R98_20930 [Gemmataceae bacterium]|nr:hypothetical protein [Gemmataceae bacterium]
MIRLHIAVIGLLATAWLGATAREGDNKVPDKFLKVLEKADALELYSLQPDEEKGKDSFHGWKVLGKTTVKEKEPRTKLLGAVLKGIADSDGSAAKCLIPRHGLRAVHDGKTVDLVICFECHHVYIYADKEEKRELSLTTAETPQPTLDKILTDAGIKLAPKANE